MKKKHLNAPNGNPKRQSHNQKIRDAHLRKAQEKEAVKQEREARQQAVNAAMDRYKAKKRQRLKKLVKKTRHGQPVMQGQIELLLDKIQQQKQKQ